VFRNVSEYFSLLVWTRTSKSSEELSKTFPDPVLNDFISVSEILSEFDSKQFF
jgi:hypothetical protein